MTFDPMTGEPIENSNDNLQFDPMTGEPIGQPSPAPAQEATGFDPMTGQPIGWQPEPTPVQEATGFDPMTGQPIGQQSAPVQEATGFDPMTGKPIQNKNGKSRLPLILGGAAALVVVAVIAVMIISSGLFLGKSGKVMLAATNTFKDTPKFVNALKPLSVLGDDKYTVSLSGDVYDTKFSGDVRSNGDEKQIYMNLNLDGDKYDMLAGVDSKSVKAQVPALSNYVFVYNYKGKNTGYVADYFKEDDIEDFNDLLEFVVKFDAGDMCSDMTKVVTDELKKAKFVNAEKREYTINEKDIDCKGYTAVLTGSNMIHIMDGMEKVVNKHFAPLYEIMDIDEDDIAKLFDEEREDMEDMEDFEVTFYIYKNKLAAIRTEIDGEKVELCFEGGDYRMQNMVLRNGDSRMNLKGSSKGSKETFTLTMKRSQKSDPQTIGTLEYNAENGKFSLSSSGATLEGKLTSSKNELTVKITSIGGYYFSIDPDLTLTVKKGAKMDKYSSKVFDIGNADEDDCLDLLDDVMEKYYDGNFGKIERLFRSLDLY